MGVYVNVNAEIKSQNNLPDCNLSIDGLSYSKWEHPLESLFGGDAEKYDFIAKFFNSVLTEDEMNYLRKQEDDEDGVTAFTESLNSLKLYSIISKIDISELNKLLVEFDQDDENGKIQFLTSFAQLKSLTEIEKERNSEIIITFIYM